MNSNLQTWVLVAGSIGSLCGAIITTTALWRSNKSGFRMMEFQIASLKEVLGVERESIKSDILAVKSDITGLKTQNQHEIFPRLNTLEGNVKKNCRALIDHQKLCDSLRQNSKC